jgi:hypothetical protein
VPWRQPAKDVAGSVARAALLLLICLAGLSCPAPGPQLPAPPEPAVFRPAGAAREWFAPAIDADRAISLVAFLDERFRVAGNSPYRESLDEVEARLRTAGFGTREDLVLERWTLAPIAPTWEPLAGSLEVVEPVQESLSSFVSGADRERTLIMVGSPGTDGPIAAELVRDGPGDPTGKAVLASGPWEEAYRRLAERKAAVVLLSSDGRPEGPTASDEAIPLGYVPDLVDAPVALSLSRRVERRLRGLLDEGEPVVLRVRAEVRLGTGPVEALHAEVRGGPLPGLLFVAHLDEPGAEDNASGVATAVGIAEVFGLGIKGRGAPPPNRSIHFVIGPEFDAAGEAASRYRDSLGWAIALDQVGRPITFSPENPDGTRGLVERPPDPSLRWPVRVLRESGWLPPAGLVGDAPWYEGPPSLLPDVLFGLFGERAGWVTHPYEGESDHAPLLQAGIPAALIWKFPDPTYHTSLDRLGPTVVSVDEIAAVGEAMVAGVTSLAWEDGTRVASAATYGTGARVYVLATGDKPAACAWGAWLGRAIRDLEAMLGYRSWSPRDDDPAAALRGWATITLKDACAGRPVPWYGEAQVRRGLFPCR